jgi:hypothetical protein
MSRHLSACLIMSYNRTAAWCPTGQVSEVKCANNIGIKLFVANPFVSRETGCDPARATVRHGNPCAINILAVNCQPRITNLKCRFSPDLTHNLATGRELAYCGCNWTHWRWSPCCHRANCPGPTPCPCFTRPRSPAWYPAQPAAPNGTPKTPDHAVARRLAATIARPEPVDQI